MAERLQRHRLAEQRVCVRRIQLQAALEAEQRGSWDPPAAGGRRPAPGANPGVSASSVQALVEGLRGVFPRAAALQADRQVEPAHGVLRLDLRQHAVALGRLLEVAQLELDVAHRAIDLGRGLIGGDGALQLFQRLLAFACQVQRYGSRQMALRAGALLVRVQFNACAGSEPWRACAWRWCSLYGMLLAGCLPESRP